MVAKSQGVSEIRLRQLLQAADQAIENKEPTTSPQRDIAVSVMQPRYVAPDLSKVSHALVSVATDMKTGWFVQLVSQEEKPLLLTIGRKFCISGYDEVNRQIATKMLS